MLKELYLKQFLLLVSEKNAKEKHDVISDARKLYWNDEHMMNSICIGLQTKMRKKSTVYIETCVAHRGMMSSILWIVIKRLYLVAILLWTASCCNVCNQPFNLCNHHLLMHASICAVDILNSSISKHMRIPMFVLPINVFACTAYDERLFFSIFFPQKLCPEFEDLVATTCI